MKLLIILFFISCITLNAKAQLKAENFLLSNDSTSNINIYSGAMPNSKFITIKKTGFKYEDQLSFYYYPPLNSIGINFCCNYYEVKCIPKDWNIVSVKDVVEHMEDKTMGFSFKEKKLFFVEFDKERKIYKAYQVDIIGWPREE